MTGSMAQRASRIPEANKMARMLRSGRTTGELAERYRVHSTVIINQLASHGYDPKTGDSIDREPEIHSSCNPLALRGGGPGQSGHYVGGGDNPNVVSTIARPLPQRRPRPTGFAWPTVSAEPVAVAPKPKKPVQRSTGSRWGTRGGANRKLTQEQENAMASAYLDGESSGMLARTYGVHERTVRKRLVDMGVVLRTRSEAQRLSVARRHAAVSAVGDNYRGAA